VDGRLLHLAAPVAATLLLIVPSASAAVTQQSTWSYDPATHRLVGAAGEPPFTLKGGSPVTGADGVPALQLTQAPSLATYSANGFPGPGSQDFTWTAVMSMDRLNPRSTPNVAQIGLSAEPQIKLQLDRRGVPQCVFHGTRGRLVLTSTHATLNDGGLKHTLSCWRRAGTLGVTVDGLETGAVFDVGAISPTRRPTIGNKSPKAGAKDQLFGKFWSLTVTLGSS
jgi:hypothetical protein